MGAITATLVVLALAVVFVIGLFLTARAIKNDRERRAYLRNQKKSEGSISTDSFYGDDAK